MASDLLEVARQRARENSFWSHLGVRVDDAREGWIRLRLAVRPGLCNAPGAPLHGGVYAALVDMAVGGALSTMQKAGAGGVNQTTLDLNVSFLSGIRDGELVAEGQILKRGRSIAFGEGRLTDPAGRLLAVGRATYMILAQD